MTQTHLDSQDNYVNKDNETFVSSSTGVRNKSDSQDNNEYSWLIIGYLLIVIIYGAFRSIYKFIGAVSYGSITVGLFSFFCEIANIIFIIFVLRKKAWGIWAFFGMMLLQIPVNLIFSGSENIETVIISAIVRIVIMVLVLMIKKDGVSGWEILLSKESLLRLKESIIETSDEVEGDAAHSHNNTISETKTIDGVNETEFKEATKLVDERIVVEKESGKTTNEPNLSEENILKPESILINESLGISEAIPEKLHNPSRIEIMIKSLPLGVSIGYIIWFFINLILFVISWLGGFCFNAYLNGHLNKICDSTEAFFPFSSVQGGYLNAVAWDVACYDWTELLIYLLVPLICIWIISLIIRVYKK